MQFPNLHSAPAEYHSELPVTIGDFGDNHSRVVLVIAHRCLVKKPTKDSVVKIGALEKISSHNSAIEDRVHSRSSNKLLGSLKANDTGYCSSIDLPISSDDSSIKNNKMFEKNEKE